MKKTYLLLSAILIGFLSCAEISAQNNAFSAKKRTVLNGKAVSPRPVNAIPYKSSSAQNSRTASIPSYTPSQLNFSSIYLNQNFKKTSFDQNGRLIFLDGSIPKAGFIGIKSSAAIEAASFEYLDAIKSALQIENPREEFKVISSETDDLGMHHIKMQQVCHDIPVWCSEIYLHSRQDQINLYNGNCYPTPLISSLNPDIPLSDAVETSINDISNRTVYRELNPDEQEFLNYDKPTCELVIYHKDRNPFHAELTWHVEIRPNLIEEWEYFIDANTGQIIHYYNNTHSDGDVTANGTDLNGVNRNFHAYLENSVYYLADISRPMFNSQNFDGILGIYDAQNTAPGSENFTASMVTSSNNTWNATSVSAIYNAQLTYEYFRTVHNRNSYNNQGGAVKSIIHVADDNGGGLDNAFWNGIAIFYGDGQTAFKPLAGGLDVGAHELGHAFEGAASNLEYQGQSGAIAESYADFSGAMVERQNWTIGEQVVKTAYYPSGCLRNMADPHNGGSSLNDPGYQPANLNEMYTGSEDNGGVHINSGIPNNAFYRVANAIGKDKTEKIFWRACFNYNTRSTQFIDLRLNTIQSAKDLFGANSTEQNAVANAFDQVGIMDGQAGNYQTDLQVNPGQDYILFCDLVPSDPNTLYICSTDASNFIPLSTTSVNNKPSIMDDGSYAVFISGDKIMKSIQLSQDPNESVLQNQAIWDNAAISKDGKRLSAITIYEDSSIWVYSFQLQEWMNYHLYNSTTAQGEETNTVVYADVMEWDYSGEYIMYDALSRIENPYGDPIEYWDINLIKVWDNASNSWGSGEIFKLFGNLPAGISVGNPSLSKNSPYVFAFDLLDESTNTVTVAAANFETGDVGEIFTNYANLGTPNYSKLDNQLIFSAPDGGDNSIAIIGMQADKISPSSTNANVLIPQAKWGLWFSQGSRPLLNIEEVPNDFSFSLYPNPSSGKVSLSIDPLMLKEDITLQVFDTRGVCLMTIYPINTEKYSLDLEKLPAGLYLINLSSESGSVKRKLLIR